MLPAHPSSCGSDKAPEAFRTISEVSAELDVPQHVLRFWEQRFAQVKPIKRGGNRRYYRPEDVDLLRGIRTLLYGDGFTIKGVQKLIREQGVRYVAGLGRADCSLIKSLSGAVPAARARDDDGLSHARAAIAAIGAAHPDVARQESISRLSETARVRLEILLAELLQLKSRLHAAPVRLAAE